MKKRAVELLSSVLSLVILLSSLCFPSSALAETPESLEKTPIIANAITGYKALSTPTVNAKEVSVLPWCSSKGVEISSASSKQLEQKNLFGSTIYSRAELDRPLLIGNVTHIILYVDIKAENTVLPTVSIADTLNLGYDPYLSLGVGDTYFYAAEGSNSWSTATAIPSRYNGDTPNNEWDGAIKFDGDFKGYIKLDIQKLKNDDCRVRTLDYSKQQIVRFMTFFEGVGGEKGNVVAGPYFTVSKDSDSAVVTTPEIEAVPIEKYDVKRSGGFGNKVYPIENCSLSGESFERYTEWEVPQNQFATISSCNLQFLNINEAMKNTEGYMFYLSVPKKTTATFVMVLNSPEDTTRWSFNYPPSMMPLSGEEYYCLADGCSEWKSQNLIQTNENGSRYRASIYFESGFSGYIKLPYTSLGNDSGFVFKPELDSISSIVLYFDRFGGKYGEVVAGPNFLVANDGISNEIILTADYNRCYSNTAFRLLNYKTTNGSGIDSVTADTVINKKLGIKGITINNKTLFEFSDNTQVGPQYVNSVNVFYNSEPLTDTEGLLIYVKLPAANLMVLDAVLQKPEDTGRWKWDYEPEISLFEGQKCLVLPLDGNEWQEKTVVKASSNSYKGGIEFDSAFEGYIKIPYSALKNDSGLNFSAEKDMLNVLKIRFKRVGGGYGKVSVSDCCLLKQSTPSNVVDLADSGKITVVQSNAGSVSVSNSSAYSREKISVGVTPDPGYTLKTDGLYITYSDFSGKCKRIISDFDKSGNTFSFEMPNARMVTLNAEFVPETEQNFTLLEASSSERNSLEFTLREFNNSYTASAKGVLIATEESLGENKLSVDLKGTDIVNTVFSTADSTFNLGENRVYSDYTVRLRNIKPENRGRNYVVRGYCVINGEYKYTSAVTVNYNEFSGAFSDYKSFPDIYMNNSGDCFYDMTCSYADVPCSDVALTGGIKAEANTLSDKSVNEVQDSPYWFRMNFSATSVSEYNCIGIYVKTPMAKENCLYINFKDTAGGDYKVTAGHKYCLINRTTGEKEYRLTVDGTNRNWGIITLPAEFDGLICLPLSALNPQNSITQETQFNGVTLRFGFIGNGENSVTAGPLTGFVQENKMDSETELSSNVNILSSAYKIDNTATEMKDDSAILYWNKCKNAENYLLKAYKRAVGGYSCVAQKVFYSNSGLLDSLENGKEYLITLIARDKRDNIVAEYCSETLLFEPSESFCDIKKEDIIYDTVNYSDGNVKGSPFVSRSYTTLNAYNSSLLNSNPNRGFRGCIDFYHFNLNDAEIKSKLDNYVNIMSNNGVNTSVYVCYLYPGDYISGDLGDEFFITVQKIFDYFRKNKIQILLRFAYYDENNFNTRTPTTEEILRHITQLSVNGIVEKNKDVLHAFQVGFIGKYGEWHSDTPANTSADRGAVLNAFVEKLLPDGVYVQLRMPQYKDFLSVENVLKYTNRIGFNLDSFFGISDGTETGSGQYSYGYPDWERHIKEAYCVPNDAETYYWQQFDDLGIYPEGYGSAIAAAQLRLTTFSAVNGYLDQNINASGCLNGWKNLSVTKKWLSFNKLPVTDGWLSDNKNNNVNRNIFEYIRDYLGYRISAKQLSVSQSQKGMNISLDLLNYGFSAAFNITSKIVILDSQNKVVSFQNTGDPEEWYGTKPGTVPDGEIMVHKITADLEIPKQRGDYKIALQLVSKSGATARLDNNIPYENGYNIVHSFTVGG